MDGTVEGGSTGTDIPCACGLHAFSPEEQRDHQALLGRLRARVLSTEARPGGVAVRLPVDDVTVGQVMVFVRLERRSCPFLRFGLGLLPGTEQVELSLQGDGNARDVIRAELGW